MRNGVCVASLAGAAAKLQRFDADGELVDEAGGPDTFPSAAGVAVQLFAAP